MAGFQGVSTRNDGAEAFAAGTEAERRDVMTQITGTVVSYDAAKQTAVIRPNLRQTFGERTLTAPELQDVPVRHQRAGGVMLHTPLTKGDEVTLSFNQRGADNWRNEGKPDDGAPGRMHDLSDAIAVPGATSTTNQMSGLPADRTRFGSGNGGLDIKPDGTADLVRGGDSMFKILKDALNAIKAHKNGGDGMDPGDISAIDAIIARVDAIKAS